MRKKLLDRPVVVDSRIWYRTDCGDTGILLVQPMIAPTYIMQMKAGECVLDGKRLQFVKADPHEWEAKFRSWLQQYVPHDLHWTLHNDLLKALSNA